MNREKAIQTIMTSIASDTAIVSSTGLISREIFEKFDSVRNLYVPGSMGLASSIGLGLAISLPDKQVLVIDGDASLLMNLGSLVTIGNLQPRNLLHIVLDNGAYASCSEECSMSHTAHIDKLAVDVGYQYVKTVNEESGLRHAILTFMDGPSLILAHIELGGRRDFLRPLQLTQIKKRFMLFLKQPTKGDVHHENERQDYL